MIHPSTMAGPNWFTGSFGTINPFQQAGSPFFRGQQGGFGPGNIPFQSQPFGIGTHTTQLQNTVNEIVRQTVPQVLAACGIPSAGVFQNPLAFQIPIGQPTAIGTQFPIGSLSGPQVPYAQWAYTNPGLVDLQSSLQNPIYTAEVIRQVTNQTIQNLLQQNPNLFTQGLSWQAQTFQPFAGIGTSPFMGAQSAFGAVAGIPTTPFMGVQNAFGTSLQQQLQQQQLQQQLQQQSLANFVGQVCQAVTASVIQGLMQQNQAQATPFSLNNPAAQFGVTSGIPTGAGAF